MWDLAVLIRSCSFPSGVLGGTHGYPELRCFTIHRRAFHDALATNIGVDHRLIIMQQLSCRGEVMDSGSIGDDGVNQTCVLGGAGGCSQGGIDDRLASWSSRVPRDGS